MAELDNTSFMMKYDDESMIRQRLSAQKKRRLSIKNDTVEIDSVVYSFTRREFPQFSMVVPESLEEMPQNVAKQMFPYEDRPAIILSDSAFRICLAFNQSERSIKNLPERLTSFQSYIQRVFPTAVFFSNGIYRLENSVEVAYYDYRYPAADSDLYDFTFCTDLPDIELLGWFICPLARKGLWEPLMREMIRTIEIIPKEA